MAAISQPWSAYAHLQNQLSKTRTIVYGGDLEEALNIIHQPGFTADHLSEDTLTRLRTNASRQARHRTALLRREQASAQDDAAAAHDNDDGDICSGAFSLDDAVHAQRELQKIADYLPDDDWNLLVDASTGENYQSLAQQHSSTPSALRSRVCRIRAVLVARRTAH